MSAAWMGAAVRPGRREGRGREGVVGGRLGRRGSGDSERGPCCPPESKGQGETNQLCAGRTACVHTKAVSGRPTFTRLHCLVGE